MSQYKILNAKSSNSQLKSFKSGMKNVTQVILNFSSNVVGDSNDEINFSRKLLLTNTQVSRLHKTFANNSSANIKSSKTQLHKIGQSEGFLGGHLGPLLKTGLPLIKGVLKPLAKGVLITLGSTASASATDAAIQKRIIRSGVTTLIISNKETNDIMKIDKSLEESGLLIKGVNKSIKNKAEEQKGGFLGMLLGTLDASVLGNLLAGKGMKAEIPRKGVLDFLISPHPLTNFEIQKYY